MIGLYARKSTKQEKANDEEKSVPMQFEAARDFAAQQPWTEEIPEDLVIGDDGISGGEFDPKKRPGLAAVMQAARDGRLTILITRNQSRLARRQRYAMDVIHDLTDLGVKIYFYETGQEVKFDTATNRLLVGIQAFGDEHYRESNVKTGRDRMRQKARRGDVCGSVPFGYEPRCTKCHKATRPRRSCDCKAVIERLIVEPHRPIVVRIFTLVAEGHGFQKIAKRLTAERVADRTWSGSTIRAMVHNELYRGVFWYGRTQKEDHGQSSRKVRSENVVRKEMPELRLVSDDLWNAAHARLKNTTAAYLRFTNGRVWGRPESGTVSPYLLTGLSVCGQCGASLLVRTLKGGRYAYYACSYHHLRGDKACPNNLTMPMKAADTAVLTELREHILNPKALAYAIETVIARLGTSPKNIAEQRAGIERELAKLGAEIDNLYAHLASGLQGIPEQIKTRERRQETLRATLHRLDLLASMPTFDQAGLTAELRSRLDEWRSLLAAESVKARQIIRKLVGERIVFTPEPSEHRYHFAGHAEYSKVLSGTLFQSFALTGSVAQAGLPQVARGGEETWGGMNSTKHEALPGVPQVRLGVSEASPRENNSLDTSLVQNRASRGPFLYTKVDDGDSDAPAAPAAFDRPTVCGTSGDGNGKRDTGNGPVMRPNRAIL